MIIIPAIDLKGGRCVRLRQGRMDDETVYSDNPVEVAVRWASLGADLIHIVDLDGAVEGMPKNIELIKEMTAAVEVPIQIGGGIRNKETAESYLSIDGVKRIILGTVAIEDPDFVKELAGNHPGRVAVGIDAKDGLVAVKGWVDISELGAVELAHEFENAGVAAIIYTDISRDGMLSGPNVDGTAELAASVEIPVIASGGMSTISDIYALKEAARNLSVKLEGVIVGKALYDGRIELTEAIERARGDR